MLLKFEKLYVKLFVLPICMSADNLNFKTLHLVNTNVFLNMLFQFFLIDIPLALSLKISMTHST